MNLGRQGAITRRRTGQGGFTLLEVVLVVAIASIGILTIAIGLLTSVTADNRANDQQRLNLAMTTFSESIRWIAPAECGPDFDPEFVMPPEPPNSETVGTTPDNLLADFLLTALEEPEMQAWVSSGVTFKVTDVAYWDPERDPALIVADPDSGFSKDCHEEGSRWPVVRVGIGACWGDPNDGDSGECRVDRQAMDAQVVKRGPSGNAAAGG